MRSASSRRQQPRVGNAARRTEYHRIADLCQGAEAVGHERRGPSRAAQRLGARLGRGEAFVGQEQRAANGCVMRRDVGRTKSL